MTTMQQASKIHQNLSVVRDAGQDKKSVFALGTALTLLLKRTIDVVVSIVLLLIFSLTVFPLVALVIILDSRGGIFYVQKRTGKYRQTFQCFKLRTMRPSLAGIEDSDELRITTVGYYLRKTHIDELPQLVNVLFGDMSLVGPRPHMLSDTERFESMAPDYHFRHMVRPGITGLAQVNGYYGWVDDENHLQTRVKYDLEYISNLSAKGDVYIMIRTLFLPLKIGA